MRAHKTQNPNSIHTYDGKLERRPRHGLRHHEEEDGEGEHNGNATGNLLPRLRGQTERHEDEHGQHEAGQHDVDEVVGGTPFETQLGRDVRVANVGAARKHRLVPHDLRLQDLPLAVLGVVVQLVEVVGRGGGGEWNMTGKQR